MLCYEVSTHVNNVLRSQSLFCLIRDFGIFHHVMFWKEERIEGWGPERVVQVFISHRSR